MTLELSLLAESGFAGDLAIALVAFLLGAVIGPLVAWLQLYPGRARRARIESRRAWEDFERDVERLYPDMQEELGQSDIDFAQRGGLSSGAAAGARAHIRILYFRRLEDAERQAERRIEDVLVDLGPFRDRVRKRLSPRPAPTTHEQELREADALERPDRNP